VLSEHSINSAWVKTEIGNARRKELSEGKRVLFPIRLISYDRLRTWQCFDADSGIDSAREIREFFIPDFTAWADKQFYRAAFGRLLDDRRDIPRERER
jgi:hypothetical protein